MCVNRLEETSMNVRQCAKCVARRYAGNKWFNKLHHFIKENAIDETVLTWAQSIPRCWYSDISFKNTSTQKIVLRRSTSSIRIFIWKTSYLSPYRPFCITSCHWPIAFGLAPAPNQPSNPNPICLSPQSQLQMNVSNGCWSAKERDASRWKQVHKKQLSISNNQHPYANWMCAGSRQQHTNKHCCTSPLSSNAM